MDFNSLLKQEIKNRGILMKQLNSLPLIFTFVLLLNTNLATAMLDEKTAEIPFQIENSDRIVIGTVSEINPYSTHTIYTITVKEWLYNPLPVDVIKVETRIGTNLSVEDEAEFAKSESVLLMLKDVDLNNHLFDVTFGFPGKHRVSDRDAVIKELKALGKWNREDQIGNISNSTGNEKDIPQRLPLTFGPRTLDKLKNDTDFIAAYGSIPNFSSLAERDQWINTLGKITDEVNGNFDQEMSKYFYPKGPIISYGVTINGVIEVGINRNSTVEKPFMDGIYQIFDSKATLIGIKEVPVLFVHADIPVPLTSKIEPVVKTANLSTSGNKSSRGNESSKAHSVPGFGLFGSLTCLYVVWKLRKK